MVAPESTMPVAEVVTEGGCVGFGGLQSTISAYDNVSMLLNLLLLLKFLCAVPHLQAFQPLLSVQPCIFFAQMALVLCFFSFIIHVVVL